LTPLQGLADRLDSPPVIVYQGQVFGILSAVAVGRVYFHAKSLQAKQRPRKSRAGENEVQQTYTPTESKQVSQPNNDGLFCRFKCHNKCHKSVTEHPKCHRGLMAVGGQPRSSALVVRLAGLLKTAANP
jgi:hypothetical protein